MRYINETDEAIELRWSGASFIAVLLPGQWFQPDGFSHGDVTIRQVVPQNPTWTQVAEENGWNVDATLEAAARGDIRWLDLPRVLRSRRAT